MRYILSISILFALLLITGISIASEKDEAILVGSIHDLENNPVEYAEIILKKTAFHTTSDLLGNFELRVKPGIYTIIIHHLGHQTIEQSVELKIGVNEFQFLLNPLEEELTEVQIRAKKSEFSTTYLRSVEGTAIYASKKSELIEPEKILANKAINNARQVYAKVPGLNIWESDRAGIQLDIGARGLSPSRTANFNTRQNGSDISADALGYPESYYVPPVEAIERIEIVRGAAGLQYGTQFGGLLNFKLKKGPSHKRFEFVTRQTGGSWGLYNQYTSIGGTDGKWRYYAYYNYKRGSGWRDNADFKLHNGHASVQFFPSEKVELGAEFSTMTYNAQQPGGLSDALFEKDPQQSIRDRNWFQVNWNILALTAKFKISKTAKLDWRNFGLIGSRDALGFLGQINRIDPGEERDLLMDQYRNYGTELRFLKRYKSFNNPSTFLLGARVYKGYTKKTEGLGSDSDDSDFNLINPEDPYYSQYTFPGFNAAIFGENLFTPHPNFSITPGFRYEFIRTEADGFYNTRVFDLAGNLLSDEQIQEDKKNNRSLFLAGLGMSYKAADKIEIYANWSQNFRAVNFNDMRSVNPNFRVDQNIKDESGFNADLGFRGKVKDLFMVDFSLFYLQYKDRIGMILKTDEQRFTPYRYRTNISDSRSYGFELFAESDLLHLKSNSRKSSLNLFVNLAFIDATYIRSDDEAIDGNYVELVPKYTFKSGITYKYEGFKTTLQVVYNTEQFTDATNAEFSSTAVNGLIPSYYVTDLSMGYKFKKWISLEAGINNLSNNKYFTRRASGYPGPGIIPSDALNYYFTLEFKI